MAPLDAFWHLANLFGPAIGLGLIAPTLAKLVWRRELAAMDWTRAALWVGGACAAVIVGGLVVFGRDGRMATYAAMVLAASAVLWWRGWGRSRRG